MYSVNFEVMLLIYCGIKARQLGIKNIMKNQNHIKKRHKINLSSLYFRDFYLFGPSKHYVN